jgi:pilus assembly protein FimV
MSATTVDITALPTDSTPASGQGLDFDLDLGSDKSSPESTLISLPTSADAPHKADANALDFDLGLDVPAIPVPSSAVDTPTPASSNFDFDLSTISLEAPVQQPLDADKTQKIDKVDLGYAETIKTTSSALTGGGNAPSMDLSGLSLDLDAPSGKSGGGDVSAVATKLELAKAYIEIGDADGAKEILNEVTREGSAAQQAEAKQILAGL